jgi:DNA-binding GntR family transcriptional regulator
MISTYRTLQEIAHDTIRDAILNGRYQPGQRLVADDLAKDVGVSRMPIREALHRLEVGGLVTMTPHRGAVVNEISEDEIIEIYHIRAVLDGLATRLATPHLTQDDHERLRTIVDAMGAAVKAKDLDRVLRVNREFHQIVWRAARATRLYALLENLYDASQRYRQISVLLPGRLDQITQEHRRISRALASGDATKAERFAIAHLEGTALRLIRSVEWRKRAAGSGHGPARRGGGGGGRKR